MPNLVPAPRRSIAFSLTVACVLAAPHLLHAAAGDPVGSEFKVNTQNGLNAPAVAMGGSGSFVVIWQGGSTAGNFGTLRMQRFDASGAAQGGEVTTVAAQADFPSGPAAAADANGNFVVAWANGSTDIHAWARCFSSAGTPATAGTQFDTTPGVGATDVAMTPDRNFVVVWTTADNKIRGQRGHCTDSQTAKDGSEFLVTQTSVYSGGGHAVAIDSTGRFVVVWGAPTGDAGSDGTVYARRFAADGTALTDEFIVNTTTVLSQHQPDVAMSAEGAFVVAWLSQAETFTSTDVRFQRYSAAGEAAGAETPIIATGGYDRRGPRAAMDASGNFMIAFEKYNPGTPSNYWDVWGRRFNADGSAVADAAQLNTTTTNLQEFVAMGMDSDGDTVVAWESSQVNGNLDIYGQRFGGAGGVDTTPDPFVLVDQSGAALSTTVTSNMITVAGIAAAASISVSGPGAQYDVNGGGFPSSATTVSNGDTVQVRHTSSANYATVTDTVLTIGGVSDTFSSTTVDAPVPDTTPDAFDLGAVTGANPDTEVESNVITVAGINAATPISITEGGFYQIGNGSPTSEAGTVANGQTVRVIVVAGAFGTSTSETLTIGDVSDDFMVTSRAANTDTVLDANNEPVNVSTSTGTLMNLQQVPTPIYVSSGYQYDNGFFAFDITGVTPGGTATVTMTLPAGAAPTLYIKCVGSACAVFGGASFAGNVVTLTLTDGGAGDSDGAANGTISDPGAPATATYTAASGGYDSGALGWLTLLLGLPLGLWRRWQGC